MPGAMRSFLSTLFLAAALSACSSANPMPGTALGTFSITAKQTANTCGAGLGATDPWKFDIELSIDGSELYWRQSDATVSGALDDSLQATFSGTMTESGGGDAGKNSCSLTRSDKTQIKLDSKTDTKSVTGSISFTYTVVSGTDCASALAPAGGVFDMLPCSVSYSFEGSRTKAP